MRRICPAGITAFLLLCVMSPPFSMSQASRFTLAQSSASEWSVDYRPRVGSPGGVEIDGRRYARYTFVQGIASAGAPGMPVDVMGLGIPFGVEVAAELSECQYEEDANQFVAPVPMISVGPDGEITTKYRIDPLIYAQNRYLPPAQLEVEQPFVLRGQRVLTVRLHPYQYNPATRRLRRLIRATINVRIAAASKQTFRAPGNSLDGRFEPTFRILLLNYEQAKQWRTPARSLLKAAADSTRNWFETGKTYYRMPIASDGWYRLTQTDLVAGGIPPGSVDLSTIRVLNRGREIPLILAPDTTVEFYALRKYGDSSYYDYWTDTNMYWLTWGGVNALRYLPVSQSPDTNAVAVTSVPVTRHFEVNALYYRGATQEEILQSGSVPGKDWIWEYYFPGTTISHSFQIDSIDAVRKPLTLLRARLFGTTTGSPPVSHRARFWINDSLVGEITFGQRQPGNFVSTFPTSWLRNGANTLTIQSIDTQTSPNQFYLDWFEIGYQRYLLAVNDQLEFTAPAMSGGGSASFTVAGFADPGIEVVDLDGRRQISGGSVVVKADNRYAITFRDTVSTPRRYLVVSQDGRLPTPTLSRRSFTDIRQNPQGADYIIITHPDFLAAATALASHRQMVNAVRTAVVSVQDIYDQFNYGIFNGEKIKDFLKYAYSNWKSPAPAYVLLLGDASYDDHHYFSYTVKKDFVPSWGVPTSDNWFACFDSVNTFLPSMLIGRLNVQDSLQASRVVRKVSGYDSVASGQWTKRFLFLTGGADAGEQSSFNDLTEGTISNFVTSPPLGGAPARVFKTSTAPIDSSHRAEIQNIVNNGVLFINFLGHSAGNIWSLDIGPPEDLQNTNGELPFISSVSCNVSSFADQATDNLSEHFTLAGDRGAIAMWGSVSLGYAFTGQTLTNLFLSTMEQDSVRDFGSLTTTARTKLWQSMGSDYVTLAMVQLTPLLGDPLSQLALPLKPDLAISPGDITLNKSTPLLQDSSLAVNVKIHNFGLVPPDSVVIAATDRYAGTTLPLLRDTRIPPVGYIDSLAIPWYVSAAAGKHTLSVTIDPAGQIDEVTRLNNSASADEVITSKALSVVRPLNSQVVSPGPVKLIVTDPFGTNMSDFRYAFQVDTVDTFDSPALVQSPAVDPGVVGGEWTTPSLAADHPFFWRVRTESNSTSGNWVTSCFSTGTGLPSPPAIRWKESSRRQFSRETLVNAAATDSGVRIVPGHAFSMASVTSDGIPMAEHWGFLHWQNRVLPGRTDIGLAALGVRPSGEIDTLHTYPHDSTDVSIAGLVSGPSSAAYSALKFAAILSTTDSMVTPLLIQWSLELEPPADLAISPRSVGAPDLTVPKGSPAEIPVSVYNLGYRTADSGRVVISTYDAANNLRVLATAELDSIPVDHSTSLTIPVPTTTLPRSVNLLVTVAPPGNRRDLTAENNEAPASFTLTANPAAQIRLFADGVQLMEGDYVSSHPSVVVRLPETGGGVAGQRTVSLFVDNTVVGTVLAKPAGGSGQAPVSPLDDPTFTLTLADGRHEIRTSLVEMNVVGPPDTLDQRTGVNVSSEYHILKLFNYPNPFRSETDFTFVLTGSAAPEEVSIRIFTIAGRKIRQITIPAGGAQVGFNRIHWDGRDNDGDEIANGVYFYQVLVAARGKSETAIEKLVKVR